MNNINAFPAAMLVATLICLTLPIHTGGRLKDEFHSQALSERLQHVVVKLGDILLNPKDAPADVSLAGLPFSGLTKTFHVWSFWDKKYYGCMDASLVIPQLPAHRCVQLCLSEAGINPVELLGSTLHIGMAANEVQDFTASNNQVKITLNDQGAREGELLLVSGQNLRLAEVSGCKAALSHDPKAKLYHLSINERQQGAKGAIKIRY